MRRMPRSRDLQLVTKMTEREDNRFLPRIVEHQEPIRPGRKPWKLVHRFLPSGNDAIRGHIMSARGHSFADALTIDGRRNRRHVDESKDETVAPRLLNRRAVFPGRENAFDNEWGGLPDKLAHSRSISTAPRS